MIMQVKVYDKVRSVIKFGFIINVLNLSTGTPLIRTVNVPIAVEEMLVYYNVYLT